MDRIVGFFDVRRNGLAHLSKGAASNYRSVLNRVNKSMGWDADMVFVDRLLSDSLSVLGVIRNHYRLPNTSAFRAKVSVISSIVNATGLVPSNNVYKGYTREPGKYLVPKVVREEPDWPQLRDCLREYGLSGVSRLNTIALIYSYGYVIMVSDILKTRVDGNSENHIDLSSGDWTVSEKDSRRSFVIDDDLRVSLAARSGQEWLIETRFGGEHKSSCSRSLNWDFPSAWGIRSSFKSWLDTVPLEEAKEWKRVIGKRRGASREYNN